MSTSKLSRFLVLIVFLTLIQTIFAQSGIYVGGHFRRDSTVTVPALKNSGFTYVILFNVQVEPNGDLTMDNALLCSNGKYTLASRHPNYINDVMSLREGWSSIQRVEKCIGGWGSKSYDNIKALVQSQGTGKESILYKNFKALKEAIPVVDAINNDDEHTYDVATASAFHIMLYDLGYKTTIAPYTNLNFWKNFVTTINAARPGAVDRMDLQCYDGGAWNRDNPDYWRMRDIPLHAGLLHFESSANIFNQMKTWKEKTSVVGGFLWVYNANDFSLRNHAKSINDVFGGGEVVRMGIMKPHVILYIEKDFAGTGVNFEMGNFSSYGIKSQHFPIKDLSSIRIHEGFKIELFEQDKIAGNSILYQSDASEVNLQGLDSVVSVKVSGNGYIGLGRRTFYVKNKKTGKYLTLNQATYDNGVALSQKDFTGEETQKWRFNHSADGVYHITNQFSTRAIQVKDASDEENTPLEQSIYMQKNNQKVVAIQTETENSFKLLFPHSLKYMSLDGNSADLSLADIVQNSNSQLESSHWILEDISTGIDLTEKSNIISIYPNPVNNYFFIDTKNDEIISDITLTDIQGRKHMVKSTNSNQFDVSDLASGVYFLQIKKTNGDVLVSRFIKN